MSTPPMPQRADSIAAIVRALAAKRADFVAYVERRVRDHARAEDLVQAAIARTIERAPQLGVERAATAWFYRVLLNAVIDDTRRRGTARRLAVAVASETETSVAPVEPDAGSPCRCVVRLAESLKPEYAEALQRVEVEGAAVKDFAERAGITSGNAAVRVFRAREALRKQVHATCGECAADGCSACTCVQP